MAAVPPAFRPAFRELVARRGVSVEPGWGSGNLVAKLAGKMFVLFVNGEFVVKLPRTRVEDLVKAHLGTPFDPRRNGRVMREWVVIVAGGGDWAALTIEAHAFVATPPVAAAKVRRQRREPRPG